MTHDEFIEIVKAHRDGKTIEVLNTWAYSEPRWETAKSFLIDVISGTPYRIKPEAREVWILPCHIPPDGLRVIYAYNHKIDGSTKFREVTDD